MGVTDTKCLHELERKNAELKKIVAEQALDNRVLMNVNNRKRWALQYVYVT